MQYSVFLVLSRKKYDFSNPQVFAQLEDKAIDGQLDYSDFPPPEYKYFLCGYGNQDSEQANLSNRSVTREGLLY